MYDTGFKGPSSAVNKNAPGWTPEAAWGGNPAVGSVVQPSPSALAARDGVYGAITWIVIYPSLTPYLYASGFDFSEIPDNATIEGIEVRFAVWMGPLTTCRFNRLFLTVDGSTMLGSEMSGGYDAQADWSTGPAGSPATVRTFGGATNLWGAALTPAIVKSAAFGVSMQAQALPIDESGAYVDEFTVKVHYSAPDVVAARSGTFSAALTMYVGASAIAGRTVGIAAPARLDGVGAAIRPPRGRLLARATVDGRASAVTSIRGGFSAAMTVRGVSASIAPSLGHIVGSLAVRGGGGVAVPAVIPPWMIVTLYERGATTADVVERGSNTVEI